MRNVSRQYMQTAENRRDFYATAEITFANGIKKPLEKEDFTLSGNNYTESGETSSFPLGLFVAKRVKFALMNDDDRWSDFDFYGAKIFLQTGFDLDDGTTEFLNIGTFTVITPETYGVTVAITAMDDSYKTDIDYSTELTFPVSAGVALQDSCRTCGITLLTEAFANSDYVILQKPEELTHRQFIGMIAMLAGGNAVMDEYNRLKIISYDFTPFERFQGFDGGRFDYNDLAKYTTGNALDGGSFVPWSTGDTADGGEFGDRDNIHILYRFKNNPTIDVDDVVITGIQLESKDEDNNTVTHLFGSEGYVLKLDNQLAAGKEDEAIALIGAKIVGLRFRPFSGDHVALPTAEFMDLAFVADWKSNFYQTVITDVSFTYFGCTSLKCAADSPVRNSSRYYGNMAKAIVQARQMVRKEKTEREKALEVLSEELARSSGLYMTEEQQEDKSIIYYMHDKPTFDESRIVWKMTAEAFAISTDGGKSYPYGLDATGMAILNRIYAIGLNADYINTGAFEIVKNGKTIVLMDKDTGQVILRPDTFELSDGSTIGSIAENKANAAANEALGNAKSYTDSTAKSTLQSANGYADTAASTAVNDFVSKTYDPKIAELQKQLDGQIESFYYDYAPSLDNVPAFNWKTDADKQKHEGDLFFDKTNGLAYRFFKDTSGWTWKLIKDNDISKALAEAAAAQDTADKKRRTFLVQPTPPYDEGDLWYGGTDKDVLVCKKSRQSGNYDTTDWGKADRYIDQSAANKAASDAVAGISQTDVLNKLTNDGLDKGIYLQDGKLYISFSAARGGELTLGGADNGNGRLSIRDASDNEIGYIDNEGVHFSRGTISGSSITLGGKDDIYGNFIQVLDGSDNVLVYISASRATFGNISCKTGYAEEIDVMKTGSQAKVRISPQQIDFAEPNRGSAAGSITPYTPSVTSIGSSGLKINGTAGISIGMAGVEVFNIEGNMQPTFLRGLKIDGTLTISGSKSRIVSTPDYQDRLLYCYEMPSPMFGDIGEAVTDENGECYIYLDDIFSETVSAQIEYQVFLQKEGSGDVWVAEKTLQYFVVKGTENLKFAWELKVKQRDYEYERLETYSEDVDNSKIDYEQQYLEEIEKLISAEEEVLYETA